MADSRQPVVERTSWDDTYAAGWGPRGQTGSPVRRRRLALGGLGLALERDVVPRLVLARRGAAAPVARQAAGTADAETLSHFVALVLDPLEQPALGFVERLHDDGMLLETVYLDVLAPTARRLGEYWCEDRCSFTEVTLGLWRLQQLLRHLGPAFREEAAQPHRGLAALLLPVPGEQHSFGLLMIAEFFRRAGWSVSSGPFASPAAMANALRRDWFSVVGFSVSAETHLDALVSGIRTVRRASRNPAVAVMLGGPLILDRPDLVIRLGADATAADGREAIARAHALAAAQ